MTNQTGRIAVIPARGGSKRIPRKNVKPFAGKPMISYAIGAAIESQLFDHVVVSTDDDEIANIAREYGAETPFQRPIELSDDHTPTVPVIRHAIEHCGRIGWQFDMVCCIYPCVPLIIEKDIKDSLEILNSSDALFCFPVGEYPSPIQRALRMNSFGVISGFYPEFEQLRSQDLEAAYFDAGQFYWGATSSWLTNDRIHNNSVGYVIPTWRTVDIDTPDDWQRAELVFNSLIALMKREPKNE
jgi:pseudaminic acid cytidylyltransferase